MKRALVVLGLTALLLVPPAAFVLAQGEPTPAPPQGNPADTFPAALGYAAVGLATAVWGTMVGVVGKLWKRNSDQQKDFNKLLEQTKADYQAKIDAVQVKLDEEIKERRVEAVKLLTEGLKTQQTLQRSLDEVKAAVDRLSELVKSWEG